MRAGTSTVRFRLAGVFALSCWLLWPALSAHAAAPNPTSYEAPSAHSAEEGASSRTESGDLSGSRRRIEEAAAVASPLLTGAPGTEAGGVHEFACREGHCNRCHYHEEHVRGTMPPKTVSADDLNMGRVNGTQMTRAEMAALGIRFLQLGGDWWNKCGDGWVNADAVFMRLPRSVVCEDWRTRRLTMRHLAEDRLPFPDNSIEFVYTEHMFEHILPMQCSAFLKEAYRVLKPGGVIRITTPDLEKYLMGYAERKKGNKFLADHASRWPPMGKLGTPYTAATIVNNIFRNYEHKWVYDLEEMTRTAMHAGIPESAVKNSHRMGADLPATLVEAIRRAETVGSARHQELAKENPTRCWLEQEIREQESLYVLITKPP